MPCHWSNRCATSLRWLIDEFCLPGRAQCTVTASALTRCASPFRVWIFHGYTLFNFLSYKWKCASVSASTAVQFLKKMTCTLYSCTTDYSGNLCRTFFLCSPFIHSFIHSLTGWTDLKLTCCQHFYGHPVGTVFLFTCHFLEEETIQIFSLTFYTFCKAFFLAFFKKEKELCNKLLHRALSFDLL